MSIYKSMYLSLFNAVTDALKVLEAKPQEAEFVLRSAQQKCEELYLETEAEAEEQ